MGASARALLSSLAIFFSLLVSAIAVPNGTDHGKASPLRVGFYSSTCPSAEWIVTSVVNKYLFLNPGLGAGLIRMYFHDCFIRGCDASVMLKASKQNPTPERDHPANNPSLRGWEVIDEAKAVLEALCPKTVSCADILAFAARDSSYKLGKIWYDIPSGRRDGRVSSAPEVLLNLPPPFFTADQLIATFANKNFTADEMVTLSGAHSVGISHCTSFSSRLYNFNNTGKPDPTMDPTYAAVLRRICPRPPVSGPPKFNPVVPLERVTPNKLDNLYYIELKNKRGLLTSDQTLYQSPLTSQIVRYNSYHNREWTWKYAKAMVKLGNLEPLTGKKGEIRRRCQFLN